jgi:hypothetical protein
VTPLAFLGLAAIALASGGIVWAAIRIGDRLARRAFMRWTDPVLFSVLLAWVGLLTFYGALLWMGEP